MNRPNIKDTSGYKNGERLRSERLARENKWRAHRRFIAGCWFLSGAFVAGSVVVVFRLIGWL